MYSEDGITWTQTTPPIGGYWSTVLYGNGKFVTVSSNNRSYVSYSFDGVTWKTSRILENWHWDDLAYGQGMWIAIASNSNKCARIRLNPCVNGLPFLIADKSN